MMNDSTWLCHHLFFEPQVSVDVFWRPSVQTCDVHVSIQLRGLVCGILIGGMVSLGLWLVKLSNGWRAVDGYIPVTPIRVEVMITAR